MASWTNRCEKYQQRLQLPSKLKFRYCEKATKFEKISLLFWHNVCFIKVRSKHSSKRASWTNRCEKYQQRLQLPSKLKFRYCEKATKFEKISLLFWHNVCFIKVRSKHSSKRASWTNRCEKYQQRLQLPSKLKFRYCEKATKLQKITPPPTLWHNFRNCVLVGDPPVLKKNLTYLNHVEQWKTKWVPVTNPIVIRKFLLFLANHHISIRIFIIFRSIFINFDLSSIRIFILTAGPHFHGSNLNICWTIVSITV